MSRLIRLILALFFVLNFCSCHSPKVRSSVKSEYSAYSLSPKDQGNTRYCQYYAYNGVLELIVSRGEGEMVRFQESDLILLDQKLKNNDPKIYDFARRGSIMEYMTLAINLYGITGSNGKIYYNIQHISSPSSSTIEDRAYGCDMTTNKSRSKFFWRTDLEWLKNSLKSNQPVAINAIHWPDKNKSHAMVIIEDYKDNSFMMRNSWGKIPYIFLSRKEAEKHLVIGYTLSLCDENKRLETNKLYREGLEFRRNKSCIKDI